MISSRMKLYWITQKPLLIVSIGIGIGKNIFLQDPILVKCLKVFARRHIGISTSNIGQIFITRTSGAIAPSF